MILATRFTFIVEKSWKNMYFHGKMAWPPATYDVISGNHSNWPSLNLSQNVCKGWANSYWKRQVLIFYALGKIQKNLMGWLPISSHHPPCTSEGLKEENVVNYFEFSFFIFLVTGFPRYCYSKYIALYLIQKHFDRPTMFNLNSEIPHWHFSFIWLKTLSGMCSLFLL